MDQLKVALQSLPLVTNMLLQLDILVPTVTISV